MCAIRTRRAQAVSSGSDPVSRVPYPCLLVGWVLSHAKAMSMLKSQNMSKCILKLALIKPASNFEASREDRCILPQVNYKGTSLIRNSPPP